jgi:tRNA-dihydrouridine synthase
VSNFWNNLNKPFTALAPMDDVTDVVFREIISSIGRPDVFFTEFVSIDGLTSSGREKVIKKLKFTENQHPIVAQIWGTNPKNFEEVAKLISELKFDGIDVNMGCPDKSVMKCGGGAALINEYTKVTEIIDAIHNGASNLPVSIKTRLSTTKDLTTEWLHFLLTKQINALTLHGRDAPSLSKVPADWEEIERAVKIRDTINKDIVIIGNGGIQNMQQVYEVYQKYKVDGVMIGTGIFQNPWVFDKNTTYDNKSINDKLTLLINHVELFEKIWGKNKNFEILKKFFKIYVRDFPKAEDLRKELMKSRDYSEVYIILKPWLSDN